jgi:8-oxo-dGTP pyrophosphatase MutT (NUDIX family)
MLEWTEFKECLDKVLVSVKEINSSYAQQFDALPGRAAAVLFGFKTDPVAHDINIVLTKRRDDLEHHPGEISFAGGGAEKHDQNLIETALRETHEEIGVAAQHIEVLGLMPPLQSVTGYRVAPVVAHIDFTSDYTLDQQEVQQLLELPLKSFWKREHYHHVEMERHGKNHLVHFFQFDDEVVWGMTAKMIVDLIEMVQKTYDAK